MGFAGDLVVGGTYHDLPMNGLQLGWQLIIKSNTSYSEIVTLRHSHLWGWTQLFGVNTTSWANLFACVFCLRSGMASQPMHVQRVTQMIYWWMFLLVIGIGPFGFWLVPRPSRYIMYPQFETICFYVYMIIYILYIIYISSRSPTYWYMCRSPSWQQLWIFRNNLRSSFGWQWSQHNRSPFRLGISAPNHQGSMALVLCEAKQRAQLWRGWDFWSQSHGIGDGFIPFHHSPLGS